MLQKAHRNFSIFFQMKKLYYWMKERNFRTVSLSNGGSAFHLSLTILVRYLSHSSFIEEGGSSFSRENVLYRYVFLFEFFFIFLMKNRQISCEISKIFTQIVSVFYYGTFTLFGFFFHLQFVQINKKLKRIP